MPNWLLKRLEQGNLRTHIYRALGLGLALRGLCAIFVYGPQALDDYKHGVWPAYEFFAGLPLTDFPNYRSHLLVWFLSLFVHVASWFGVTSALGQVRAMYLGLAVTSLLGIVGTYRYAVAVGDSLASRLMLYLIAAFPLMPFVSTRAFGEAVALSFVLSGYGALEYARLRAPRSWTWWVLGFASLGLATLFRFHVGLLFFSSAAILIYLRQWRGVAGAVVAGLLTLAAQAAIDLASGKAAFETLWVYLAENEGGGAKYGVTPWYSTWLFVLAMALAPFSFVFYRHLRELWRAQWTVLVPWLVFVAAHSVAAHKEERFLYPILGLELWALAFLWAHSRRETAARRVFSPVFQVVTVLGLLVVCFVNSQEGEIEPPAYVQSHYNNVIYLDNGSLFGQSRFLFYFLRPPSLLSQASAADFNVSRIDDEFTKPTQPSAVVLLTSDPASRDQLRVLEGIETVNGHCRQTREAGSLIDRLLYTMNPKHNQRRRPTWYLICERQSRG